VQTNDEAAFEFIASITPRITGQEPSPGAVRVELLQGHYLKR
jgi:hypothetical protein